VSWKNRNVLVTGADGFIGSHLSEHLARSGANVTALACYNSFDSHGWLDDVEGELKKRMKLVRGDVRDPHQMIEITKEIDTVFHLAALIAIPFSYDAPGTYVETNVRGTINILNAARSANVRRVVHTSTSEVYGTALFTPITEEHPLQGQSPYSASKIGADMMAESFYRSFGLPVVTLRPFNTYGPRQSERAVISTVIRQALDPGCDVIRVGDLTPERDFNFVTDTARAFMAVADLDDSCLGSTFNAGSGRMVSVGDMLDTVLEITKCGKDVITEEHRKRPEKSEVMALMADASKLLKASNWKPETSLEDGLAQTVKWWQTHIHRVRDDAGYMI